MSDFLDDGYVCDGYIAESFADIKEADGSLCKEKIHGPLRFKYRPAIGRLVDRAGTLLSQNEDDKFWELTTKALARDPKLLIEWDQVDRKGDPVAITEANLFKICNPKYHKLWAVIAGRRANDPLPGGERLPPHPDMKAESKN